MNNRDSDVRVGRNLGVDSADFPRTTIGEARHTTMPDIASRTYETNGRLADVIARMRVVLNSLHGPSSISGAGLSDTAKPQQSPESAFGAIDHHTLQNATHAGILDDLMAALEQIVGA